MDTSTSSTEDRPPSTRGVGSLYNPHTKEVFALASLRGAGAVQIGRSSKCWLVVQDKQVSRVHCDLAVTAKGEVWVTNRSTYGTEVNFVRLRGEEPVLVSPGAYVAIGRTTLVARPALASERVPLVATTPSSLLTRAAEVYGGDRAAARKVRRSHQTIGRARAKRRGD